MEKDTIRVSSNKAIVWPQACALCLGIPTRQDSMVIGGKGVPYCDICYSKVNRLRGWENSTFMIALIFGTISALISLIGMVVEKNWLELLRFQNWLLAGAAGMIMGGAAYAIIWLLYTPLRLIFHAKLAKPGVKILKSKEPGIIVLKFFNPDYAELFRKNNQIV